MDQVSPFTRGPGDVLDGAGPLRRNDTRVRAAKHRVISELKWAKLLPGKPACIPTQKRPSVGTKGLGHKFERDFVSQLRQYNLGEVSHNPWFQYSDANGIGYCCPDAILITPTRITIFETKLSDSLNAKLQLHELYHPVLRQFCSGRLPISCVVVVRHLTHAVEPITNSVISAIELGLRGPTPVLHWIGIGPIL